LGPPPDDPPRAAIAAVVGASPSVDPELEAWLVGLFDRRGLPFPATNLKQAWRIPSAVALPNDLGTAPGWWLDRPDGRIMVALPGPPRELRAMWAAQVEPRLAARGFGAGVAVRTFRLTGIGESAVADRLGDALLRASNPIVATYARAESLDVRVAAFREPGGRAADELVEEAVRAVLAAVGEHVWAEGATTWAAAVDGALAARGWTLATSEAGTAGALTALLGRAERLVQAASRRAPEPGRSPDELAEEARAAAGADVGLALVTRPRSGDTAASIAVVGPDGIHRERRLAFLGGELGQNRAAIAAAHVLLGRLRVGRA
jgi:nicotinamide-nucleotide amidase